MGDGLQSLEGRGAGLEGLGGGARPDLGGLGDHPALPGFGGAGGYGGAGQGLRAAADGAGARPSANQLSNFLHLDTPAAGGAGDRPNLPADRPNAPGPQTINNPFATGYAGNHPAWQNRSLESTAALQDKLRGLMGPTSPGADKLHSWADDHPERAQQLQNAGDKVRDAWNNHPIGGDWWSKNYSDELRNFNKIPGSDWWSKPHPNLNSWYYHHGYYNHPWQYWWGAATWGSMTNWFAPWGWSSGVYYDYGDDGNVVYQDNQVYVNGQDVGTADEYAQSAAALATVDPTDAEQAEGESDWLPLGTFAMSTSANDKSPTRTLQLAVDKQGILSGTMYNSATSDSEVVQGKVDKETQRVAFTIGDNSNVVYETGIYNLTKDQTTLLVHRGTAQTETYMLVRLDAPKDAAAQTSAAQPAATQTPATPVETNSQLDD